MGNCRGNFHAAPEISTQGQDYCSAGGLEAVIRGPAGTGEKLPLIERVFTLTPNIWNEIGGRVRNLE
jgi:hypothetical protein